MRAARGAAWLLWLLLAPIRAGAGAGGKARIAYVSNTWWPKVDGAAITVMGHVRHFAAAGHPVLVVRPEYADDSPVRLRALAAGMHTDPVPPSDKLTFLSYRMVGNRGAGFEPEMDANDLAAVEAGLAMWAPDVVLVLDPDYFVLDTFRVPGLNSLMRMPLPPTMIACMTTFCIEAIQKMPEYWWLERWALVKELFLQGLATSYGQFDAIFVNGETSASYLAPLRVLRGAGLRWEPLPPARVVKSRGVPADFCGRDRTGGRTAEEVCAASPALALMRARPAGTVPLIFIGRLAHDKSVDELLEAFEAAKLGGGAGRAVLFLAGSGELESVVAERARGIGAGSIVHLGQVLREHVPCVLREASAYVSAAYNETYGRSLVEALRCGLPIVTQASCNMHVTHGVNGLLGDGVAELAANIAAVVKDDALRGRLARAAAAYDGWSDGGAEPNEAMLRAVLESHAATLAEPGRRYRAWHPFWSAWMQLSILLDHPKWAMACTALVGALAFVCFCLPAAVPAFRREHGD